MDRITAAVSYLQNLPGVRSALDTMRKVGFKPNSLRLSSLLSLYYHYMPPNLLWLPPTPTVPEPLSRNPVNNALRFSHA